MARFLAQMPVCILFGPLDAQMFFAYLIHCKLWHDKKIASFNTFRAIVLPFAFKLNIGFIMWHNIQKFIDEYKAQTFPSVINRAVEK